nr:unnamed protein product [Callosobruchus analis]
MSLEISQTFSSKTQENRMRYRLENLVTAYDGTGVSDRSASLIASVVLQDVGLISNEDTSQVIGRNKLRREQRKVHKKLQNSETETVLPEINVKGLSTDQKFLLEICLAVKQGCVTTDLANKPPGKLAHSRWLTCANRIIRLYVTTKYPSQNLTKLAKFVTKVYAATWFGIIIMPSCKQGPSHILDMINRCSYLEDDLKTVVFPVIQRNAYFVHPENVLLAMLQDEKQYVKQLALRRILKARKTTKSKKLIDWTTERIFGPPFTSKYSDSELWDQIMNKNINIPIEKLPRHTQAVERGVKLITEATTNVCGSDAGDGYITFEQKLNQENLYHTITITKLKIDSNPFAKGFRDSSRLTEFERETMESMLAEQHHYFRSPLRPFAELDPHNNNLTPEERAILAARSQLFLRAAAAAATGPYAPLMGVYGASGSHPAAPSLPPAALWNQWACLGPSILAAQHQHQLVAAAAASGSQLAAPLARPLATHRYSPYAPPSTQRSSPDTSLREEESPGSPV